MLWFILSLLTAFFSATFAATLKRNLSHLSPLETAFVPLALSIPMFLLVLAVLPAPELSPGFWETVLLLLPFNLAGMLFTIWGIRISPLSLTMPFLAFTPALVIGTGFLVLGEVPNIQGIGGIAAIVAGSYVLNLNRDNHSVLDPFRAVFREKGSLLVLIASVIFSMAAVLGKKIVLQSSPLYAACIFFLVHNLFYAAAVLLSGRVKPEVLVQNSRGGLIVAFFWFLEILCHFSAIAMVETAYMIAIKRLNGLFSVLYGGMLFRESHMRSRLAGAGLMTAGAALLALAG
ncbi:MAG: EamA family transporter [Desulfovibrionales bacterium]